jgi:hypothetical protein
MRDHELAYAPTAVIGQWVRCKACGWQFVIDRRTSVPTAIPGWEPASNEENLLRNAGNPAAEHGWGQMSKKQKTLLIMISTGLLMILLGVGAGFLAIGVPEGPPSRNTANMTGK